MSIILGVVTAGKIETAVNSPRKIVIVYAAQVVSQLLLVAALSVYAVKLLTVISDHSFPVILRGQPLHVPIVPFAAAIHVHRIALHIGGQVQPASRHVDLLASLHREQNLLCPIRAETYHLVGSIGSHRIPGKQPFLLHAVRDFGRTACAGGCQKYMVFAGAM